MKQPWDYAVLPLEPTVIVTLADVPHTVWEALCSRLDEGPATAGQLVETMTEAGWRVQKVRLVDLWLEKQRDAGFIELVDGKWVTVRDSDSPHD